MRYKGRNKEKQQLTLKQNSKNYQSPDCRLKLVCMKSESLVTVNHHVTVNDLSNFAHTAHHARRVASAGHFSGTLAKLTALICRDEVFTEQDLASIHPVKVTGAAHLGSSRCTTKAAPIVFIKLL